MRILEEFLYEVKKFGIKKVAKLSGIHANTIYSWTSGRYVPTLPKAQKVAEAMGLEFLLFEKE